ncbi:PIN domain-containing protein [Roseomonas chloroacetimidivorans]|uniref:PIN domain-containing protein n=1 Tax=Roseomonas chloroacetimidivorans TaxID=1766656 RepID=UPI003C76ADE6
MPPAGPTPALLRLCLDLNVWVADFLGTRRGRRGGSSPWLADAVRSGACQAGPLQLVVSLGMLDRLALVLTREFQVEADAAETLVRAIGGVASFGPAGDHPHALVGGGVYPLRDEEDRHVLEVAVAGEADLLVTANMADFETADVLKVGDGTRIRLYPRPGQATLVIAHPDQARDWLRAGVPPLAAMERL